MPKPSATRSKLYVRNATHKDIPAIIELCKRVYTDMTPYSEAMIRGQITNYPEGQFVAVYEESVVGYCATFIINGEIGLAPHTWAEITGAGFASRHDPNGDYLYGMEVCIDPDYRRLRIGQRLYNERKKLCEYLHLKGIIFAGRMPGLARRKKMKPEDYIEQVQNSKIRDQVVNFQLRNGFEIIGVLPAYEPEDKQSRGYAAHMVWRNPRLIAEEMMPARKQRGRLPDTVRVATVQFQMRQVESFEEFASNVEYFVDVAADYKSDFVVFPEMFTLQLLSMDKKKHTPAEAIEYLTQYTGKLRQVMSDFSVRYNINIIGGSHPTRKQHDKVKNVSYAFLRDGSIHEQEKIHPTPNERYWWNIKGGEKCNAIMTDCGPIGILICYDSEFPELARHLVDQGAQMLFVPFCTDERQSYYRVRYCAQARAVENQCYVILSGNVGNLPHVENMDIQYAQSCILTPCDFPFARDGIAADTTPNTEMVAFADLKLDTLTAARNTGTVQNLKDRRFDLYAIDWRQ